MRNGAGTYVLPAGNPVVTNTTISSTWANNTLSDIAGALTQSLSKDGQTVPTANLPMGGFKLLNLAAGSAPGNSLRYEQLFSQGVPTDIASAGTVDIGGEYNTFLNVTGNTTITSLGTNYNGPRLLTFKASLTITHDATTLVLPAAENIVTQAGDVAIFIPKCTVSGTSDGWRLAAYYRDDNVPLVNDTITIASAATLNFKTAQSQFYSITGTTDVTAVTMYEAQPVYAIAAGAFKLVNSTSLVVQGAADYTTTVGDILSFIKDASGNVHVFGIVAVLNSTNDPTYASTSSSAATSPQWVNGLINGKALIQRSAVQTLNGSASYTFSVPTGAVRVTLVIDKASLTTGDLILVQLGTSGGTENTGYDGGYTTLSVNTVDINTLSTGFPISTSSAASNSSAIIPLYNTPSTNTWITSYSFSNSTGRGGNVTGTKALSGVITQVVLTKTGATGTYDSGSAYLVIEY